MGTLVIEVTKFKSDLKCVLRRHLEVAMASETTKMATRGNLHMDTRVIEVTEFNSQVSLVLRGHLEATRASEAMKVAFRSNMHMDFMVIGLLVSKLRPSSLPYRSQLYRAIALLFHDKLG